MIIQTSLVFIENPILMTNGLVSPIAGSPLSPPAKISKIDNTERRQSLPTPKVKKLVKKVITKRRKELTIKEVIKKVCIWRRLYTGKYMEDGSLVRYDLEAGARKLDENKKTLDDYLHVIKLGKKMNFEFAKYQDERFGILRKFTKESS